MTTDLPTRRRHILICNERILFRFGVDRVLVETARKFIAEGWRVSFACLRCDREVIGAITPHLFVTKPRSGIDFFTTEAECEAFLEKSWPEITAEQPVDAIITGGWPFYHVGRFGERHGIPTVFIDAGAVPHDGFDDNQRSVQRAVRRVRTASLPHYDRVWPISSFICESQTFPDRGTSDGVEIIPLGVDHLAANLFAADTESGRDHEETLLLQRLERLARRKATLVLNLGRFESKGYKNSPASFDLLRQLTVRAQDDDLGDVYLLALGKEEEADVPPDVARGVIFLGTPSDATLVRIMELSTVGFSPSLWEGFNLPIGEMTVLDKPVFAFNIGAHPEVIVHPWFLCVDVAEAVEKIGAAIAGKMPEGVFTQALLTAYRRKFAWSDTLATYFDRTAALTARPKAPCRPRPVLLMDVTNSARDTANSGVIRVTRRLTAALRELDHLHVFPVWWDEERRTYRFITGARHELLAGYNGPRSGFGELSRDGEEVTPERLLHQMSLADSLDVTLMTPEVVMDGSLGDRLDWADRLGFATAAIVHDLIPIDHPEYCSADLARQFPKYVRALAAADRIVAVSDFSLRRFVRYLDEHRLPKPKEMKTVWLPGQLSAVSRIRKAPEPDTTAGVSIVCVSTIEPRKNHATLIAAYAKFRKANPDLKVRLTLIGNSAHGADDLAAEVAAACAADPTLVWRGSVSDETMLQELRSAAFTVYPSLVEGFGLPILESLWIGKPCLCSDGGVMAELAAKGGCLAVDMEDPAALAAALERLVKDAAFRRSLAEAAGAREILDWKAYARRISALLRGMPEEEEASSDAVELTPAAVNEAFRTTVEEAASGIRHRISGIAYLGGRPPAAPPPPAPVAAPTPAPAPAAPPPPGPISAVPVKSGSTLRFWGRLFGSRDELTVKQVRETGLFDPEWYLARYPDVRASGMDPLRHFVEHGHFEHRSPGPGFDAAAYLAANPDAAKSPLSPFAHYVGRSSR